MAGRTSQDFMANWSAQARKGVLELMIMSSLSEREFYGYELIERLRSSVGVEIGDGTLYTILTRLQNEGFIRHRWENPDRGPARKYYALTKEGRTALASMRALWSDLVRAVKEAAKSDV
jgi:PadR family transcriptional regulator PadR